MSNAYLVYEGKRKSVEWFHSTNGKSQSLTYFSRMKGSEKSKFMRRVVLLGENERVHDIAKFRHEGRQIYAIKVHQHRFYCFFYRTS